MSNLEGEVAAIYGIEIPDTPVTALTELNLEMNLTPAHDLVVADFNTLRYLAEVLSLPGDLGRIYQGITISGLGNLAEVVPHTLVTFNTGVILRVVSHISPSGTLEDNSAILDQSLAIRDITGKFSIQDLGLACELVEDGNIYPGTRLKLI